MSVDDLIEKSSGRLRDMGRKAIEEAKRNGAAAYYVEEGNGKTITKENPDGSKEYVSEEGEGVEHGGYSFGR